MVGGSVGEQAADNATIPTRITSGPLNMGEAGRIPGTADHTVVEEKRLMWGADDEDD